MLCLVVFRLQAQNAQPEQNPYTDSLKDLMYATLDRGHIDSSLEFNTALIRYYRDKGEDYEYVRQNINRAEILRMIGGREEALRVLESVEELCLSLPLSTVRSSFYNRKAAILHESKEHIAALDAVHESQRIDSIKGYQWRLSSNLMLEGALYRDLFEFEKARDVLLEAYELALAENDTDELASAAYNLTLLSARLERFEDAVRYGRNYLGYGPHYEVSITYGDVIHLVAQSYEQLGRWDSAFYFLDSVYGIRMRRMQQIIDDNADKYKVVNQLEKERLENSVLQSEQDQSHLQLLILVLAVIVAILLIHFANKQRLHYKKLNSKQEDFNRELQESLEFKNKLISIVAHDIRNPMASLKGLIHVYNEGLVDERDLRHMMGGLEATVANVDLLLENLLNWVRTQSESLQAYREEIQIRTLVHTAISEAQAQLKAKNIHVSLMEMGEGDVVMSDPNFVSFALRNILSNAIKFSEENSTITISCSHSEDMDCLEIRDYGRGMNADTLERLRANNISRSGNGTGNEKGTGLGIGLSMEFLEKVGGMLEIDSELGEGTRVRICLPRVVN